ncbi:MAG TPA: DUF3857 domain-containing protein [Parasegetibacter sp.]
MILCKKSILLLAFTAVTALTYGQNLNSKVWTYLSQNNFKEAEALLKQAISSGKGQEYVDAYITNIYLKAYHGQAHIISDFSSAFYDKTDNPFPYLFALWFYDAVLGNYGKKQYPHQLNLINRILSDKNVHGTIAAAARYQSGMHYFMSNEREKSLDVFSKIGNIRNWQYVGPFENLSESGFHKDHGPLTGAGATAEFLSATYAPIRWFTPPHECSDGWTPMVFQINKTTAVSFAQTFVEAPAAMEVYLNVGATGAVKVWLNDQLMISEYRELVTEFDTYTVKARLQKGVNRILVQLSYTNESNASFAVRLTDENFRPIEGLSGTNAYKSYSRVTGETPTLLPHFAEKFFAQKIAEDSSNLLNYMLLTDVYKRNKKIKEARHIIEKALKMAPDNNILRLKLLDVHVKEDNRTAALELVEKIRNTDPGCYLDLDLAVSEDMDNQRFDAAAMKNKKKEELYGETLETISSRITILANEEKFDEMLKVSEAAIKKYPEAANLINLAYSIQKEVYRNTKNALSVYENYLKKNYNPEILETYIQLLEEQGKTKESLSLKLNRLKYAPSDPTVYSEMAAYYFSQKQYSEAEKYIRNALALSPYNEALWASLGDIKNEQKDKAEAAKAYSTSLKFNPNQYELINKLRKLNGLVESYQLVDVTDLPAIVKNGLESTRSSEYGFYVLHDEKNVILYHGGGAEQYILTVLKITSQKGIDRYKESSFGFRNGQNLLIEKAEVHKKSGAKIDGERSGNQVVFTNLEAGDVLVFKYRTRNYYQGRFAKDYWDVYFFNGQIPVDLARYTILVPGDKKIQFKLRNHDLQPTITKEEDFQKYTWEINNPAILKDEPLSPPNIDVATVLHISTLSSWKDISDWYADVTNNTTEEDYEIEQAFELIFPKTETRRLTEFEKAKRIYDFIESNIRYSSVAFRQGAYIPQRASVTLNTRLGDCKDLSNLFVTFCRMAGIEAQMVLVDTRDNGMHEMELPSLDFNHCIVKARLDNKEYYIELTDHDLPFTALPNTIPGSQMLEIPLGKMPGSAGIGYINPVHKVPDSYKRKMLIMPIGDDLEIAIENRFSGNATSYIRSEYKTLQKEEQMKNFQELIAGGYKSNLTLENLIFKNLEELSDTLSFSYRFKLKDQISEIGNMKAFRINYPDIIASLNYFSADNRTLPIEYTSYEDMDEYETVVTVNLPEGMKFQDLPTSESLSFGTMKYTLSYRLIKENQLEIIRKFNSDRKRIPAQNYTDFKAFFEKIVKAEQKMIAFKINK